MKVNGFWAKPVVLESIHLRMVLSIEVNGKEIYKMEKEKRSGQMVLHLRANI